MDILLKGKTMIYKELKEQINNLNLQNTIEDFLGFEECIDYANFKTLFAMRNKPRYTLIQLRNNPEQNTSETTWILGIPQDDKLYAIDAGTEEEMCDQFFNLVEMINYGFGTVEIRQKSSN